MDLPFEIEEAELPFELEDDFPDPFEKLSPGTTPYLDYAEVASPPVVAQPPTLTGGFGASKIGAIPESVPLTPQQKANFGTAMEVAGALVAPEVMAPFRIAKGVGAAGKLLEYGAKGAQSALGALAGKKLAQAGELSSPTDFNQDLSSLAKDTAINTAIPSAISGLAAGGGKLLGLANTNERVASMFGAPARELDVLSNNTTAAKIGQLRSPGVSPSFVSQVLKEGDINKAAIAVQARLGSAGEEIGQIYSKNASITVSPHEILTHPTLIELRRKLTDPAVPPPVAAAYESGVKMLEETLAKMSATYGDNYPLDKVWELRKNFDMLINFDAPGANILRGAEKGIRSAISETLENKLKQSYSDPSLLSRLSNLNAEYSGLSDVAETIGVKAGKTLSKVPLLEEGSFLLSPKGLASTVGLNSNRARALAFKGEQALNSVSSAGNNLSLLTGASSQLLNPSIPLLPRDSKAILTDGNLRGTILQIGMATGLITSPNDFNMAPMAVKKEIIRQAMAVSPQSFESGDEGYQTLLDGKLLPEEASEHLDKAMKADVSTRSKVVGALLDGGKYVPLVEDMPLEKATSSAPQADYMGSLMGVLDIEPEYQVMNGPLNPNTEKLKERTSETDKMLKMLNESVLGRDYSRSGL